MKKLLIIIFLFVSLLTTAQSVTLSKATFGLDKINNTADLDKPISKAAAASLNSKSDSLKALHVLNTQLKISLQIKSDSIKAAYNLINAQTNEIIVLKQNVTILQMDSTDLGAGFKGLGKPDNRLEVDFSRIDAEILLIKKSIAEILARLPQQSKK